MEGESTHSATLRSDSQFTVAGGAIDALCAAGTIPTVLGSVVVVGAAAVVVGSAVVVTAVVVGAVVERAVVVGATVLVATVVGATVVALAGAMVVVGAVVVVVVAPGIGAAVAVADRAPPDTATTSPTANTATAFSRIVVRRSPLSTRMLLTRFLELVKDCAMI